MAIGVAPGNEGLLLAASILAFMALPVFFFVVVTLLGLAERILRIKSGLSWLAPVVVILGALLAASLLLDRGGQVLPGQVIGKTEDVVVNDDGSWNDRLSLRLRYSVLGHPLSPFTSTADALTQALDRSNSQELVTLSSDSATFDRLRAGDTVELRVLRVEALFNLVRLANQSTATLLPWAYIALAVGVVALALAAWRLRRTPFGYRPLLVLGLVALAAPLLYAYRNWTDAEDLSRATERVAATVQTTTRVREISLSSGDSGAWTMSLPQPYDIVQLAFVPDGYRDTIIAVDAVDATDGQPSRFELGVPVDVVYVPGDPRNARIPGQTRTRALKTTLGVYLQGGAVVLAIPVLAVLARVIGRILLKLVLKLLVRA
jgi:hypothetical protein